MLADSATNGMKSGKSLRIVMIGLSIRSTWRNPCAETHRQVVRALSRRGHDVLFLEERRNTAVVEQMKASGAAAVLDFDTAFADIRYHAYDPLSPRDMGVWLGAAASTADVMVLLAGGPAGLDDVFRKLQAPHVVRIVEEATRADGSDLKAIELGAVITPYHPLPATGAASVAKAIEQAWLKSGIIM